MRRHRVAAGLSQEQLAELSGLHFTYISEIETGKRNPSVNVLRKIASGLNVRLSQLVSEAEVLDEGSPPSQPSDNPTRQDVEQPAI
ncbi:MAG: helix-turn-helix domain-containing protein [Chloroflexota bacterium]|nr:helix-turn-helix domain-containing protein [Chloroflexota bacterium]